MSHLWIRDAAGEWVPHPLTTALVTLAAGAPPAALLREQLGAVTGPVLARGEADHAVERWLLVCRPDTPVRVNGAPVAAGALSLADRDAIALGDGGTVFFSLERAAEVVPFPGEDDHTCCIRCKLPLLPSEPAVRCPDQRCLFWHHQSPDQPCWTYSDGCAGCGHPTAFDAGFQWTPEAL